MIVDESPLIIIDGVDIMDDPNGRLGLVGSKLLGVVSVSKLDDDADMYGVLEDCVDSGVFVENKDEALGPRLTGFELEDLMGEADPVSAVPDKLAPERFGIVLKVETLELDPAESESDELVTVGSDVDKLALEAVDIALVIEMLERELVKADCEMSVLAEDDEDSSKGKPDLPLKDKLTHAKSVQPNGRVVGRFDEAKGETGPLVMVLRSVGEASAVLGIIAILGMVVLVPEAPVVDVVYDSKE